MGACDLMFVCQKHKQDKRLASNALGRGDQHGN